MSKDNRSKYNSYMSLSENGDASEESEAGDYTQEKKKKKLKSKRDQQRISHRRMLRRMTESKCRKLSFKSVPTGYASHDEALRGQNLARSARNDTAGSSDFSIVRRGPILGSKQAAQSGFSFDSAATFAMPDGGFVLDDYLLELTSEDDVCLQAAKSEDESSEFLIDDYDGFPPENSVTYSPTDPDFKVAETSSNGSNDTNLEEGNGFELPQAAVKTLQLTAHAQSSSMSGTPSVAVATKCFMLSNMFDPVNETNPTWDEDIKNDVIEECRNHGGALHVYVDKNSPDGNVYVKCPSLTAAAATVRVLHGRYFAGRVINATYVPEANYQMLFPDSAASVTVL